jgi:hypothetical protein
MLLIYQTCCLPEKPSIILAIPLIRNAIPMNIIIVMAAATGKDIAIAAKIIYVVSSQNKTTSNVPLNYFIHWIQYCSRYKKTQPPL